MQKFCEVCEPQVEKVIRFMAEYGQFDGAHHKDWVLQEAIRKLRGLKPKDFDGWLASVGWEKGIPP